MYVININVFMYVCTYVRMYVCIYVYTYVYVYQFFQWQYNSDQLLTTYTYW